MNNQLFFKILLGIVTILFVLFVAGLIWLAVVDQEQVAQGTGIFMTILAFASGLSMIILPCTLPLVFIVVPLAAGKDYKKGFYMALLFGLGLAITISFYGIAMAYFGKIFGIQAATPWLLLIAGSAAYLFGLSEVGIVSLYIPFISKIMPTALQQKNDYIKSFFLGLLLGNAGIGCPNPVFYVLLFYIAGTANILSGFLLGLIHGLGRALPIILLTILAMFGFQATGTLIQHRPIIQSITSWMLIIMGAFLIPAGALNLRGWWLLAIPPHWYAVVLSFILILLPIIIGLIKRRNQLESNNNNH